MGVAIEPVCRPGAAIGVAVGGGLVVSVPRFPSPPRLLLLPWLRVMRLTSASLLVLPSSASLILLTSCLNVGAVVLIVAKLVAVVAIYVAEVSPRRLHGDVASRDTSRRVKVGAGEVVGVVLQHHPSNICRVAILSLRVGLVDSVVLWWKALQNNVLVLAVRGAVLGGDGI